MPTLAIPCDWHIDLDPGFSRRVDGTDLVAWWKNGRTIYASVFKSSSAEAEEALNRMLEDRRAQVRQTFDRVEPGLIGHAYLMPEARGDYRYWGLNTWVTSRGCTVCVTFFFEDPEDVDWAVKTWQTLRQGQDTAKSSLN